MDIVEKIKKKEKCMEIQWQLFLGKQHRIPYYDELVQYENKVVKKVEEFCKELMGNINVVMWLVNVEVAVHHPN